MPVKGPLQLSVMSVKTCYPRGRCREEEQELLQVEAAPSKRRGDEEKECMQQLSQCPACNQECDVVLILPCSHTMCGPCIAAGEGARSGQHHSVSPPVCSVLCPRCRHPVELPCRTWSSATSCLPKHPTLSPARGLCFSLDPSTAPPSLHLSNSSLTVAYKGDSPPGPPRDPLVRRSPSLDPCRILIPLVCADVVIRRGQYYWEVDVCNSSVYRIVCAVYDGSLEPLCTVPPQVKTIRVLLNIGGGALSFYNPLTQEHLATLSTRFNRAGVRPALGLRQGLLRVHCGLPPPAHVFLSKTPPTGASWSWWKQVAKGVSLSSQ
ncbi:LOW QUALITY PROTEIN: uncharacterized protein LKV04_010254 [Tautogolabrus adspersus]